MSEYYRLSQLQINTDMDLAKYVAEDIQENIIPGAADSLGSTTDYPELALWDSHYVFVYGTLKDGFPRHKNLTGCPLVGVGYTKVPFRMLRTNTANCYPVILMKKPQDDSAAPVFGEIYKVPPRVVRELDFIESNQFIYKRLKLPVNASVAKGKAPKQIFCWIYIGLESYWGSRMSRLLKCDPLTSNQDPKFKYHLFMKKYIQSQQAAA